MFTLLRHHLISLDVPVQGSREGVGVAGSMGLMKEPYLGKEERRVSNLTPQRPGGVPSPLGVAPTSH